MGLESGVIRSAADNNVAAASDRVRPSRRLDHFRDKTFLEIDCTATDNKRSKVHNTLKHTKTSHIYIKQPILGRKQRKITKFTQI